MSTVVKTKNQTIKRSDKRRKEKAPKKPIWQKLRQVFSLHPKSDPLITLCIILLTLCGTIMIVSTNVGETTTNSNVVLITLIRQTMYLVASFLCMWFANRMFRFKWIARWENAIVLISFVAMLVPLLFTGSGGSYAWIRLPGGVTIQPAEFAKPVLIVICATSLYRAHQNPLMTQKWQILFRKPMICYFLLMVGILLQRDIGTGAIISTIFFACLIIPTYPGMARFQKVLKRIVMISIVAFVILFWVTDLGISILEQTPFSHIATRIANAKNPYNDVYGQGYQPANALYGIASSGFFGKGIGGSMRKYGYLTQADNDYIFAVIMEETGIFGLILLCILYGLLLYRLFFYAFKTQEMAYKVILGGTGTYLFIHFFLNVGGVSGLIPSTGVPLLFISSGGSSLMACFLTMGIAQQCISQIRLKEMTNHAHRSW